MQYLTLSLRLAPENVGFSCVATVQNAHVTIGLLFKVLIALQS